MTIPYLFLCVVGQLWVAVQADSNALADRRLLVLIVPDKPPQTTPHDANLPLRSPDIPHTDATVKKAVPGCTVPEQVHLTYWSSTSVLVSWATCDAVTDTKPLKPRSTTGVSSTVVYGTNDKKLTKRATGTATSYAYDYSRTAKPGTYASPLLHHVLLKDLTPGQTYFYKVLGTPDSSSSSSGASSSSKEVTVAERSPAASKVFNFTLPAVKFPLKLGVMADPGQTFNTSEVLKGLIASKPQLLLLGGDFSYADDWRGPQEPLDWHEYGTFTYQPKWDTWARLFQPLLAHVPFMHTNGNHEIEWQPNGATHSAYNHRHPVPQHGSKAPSSFTAVSTSAPFANLYHSNELPGVFKAIFLTSYAPGQTFGEEEEQYRWLEKELENTDRSRTPWLIVSTHAPWYNSYAGHFKENDCMRMAYEKLLLKHQVDIMFFGHVHAYERNKPVADFQVDECGPVHITIGDGGNIEGLYKDFIDQIQPTPEYCSDPEIGTQFPRYQPQRCISKQAGRYCPRQQPPYSAYREPSFGFGSLELLNSTHAQWTWTKNAVPGWEVADQVKIIRGQDKKACGVAAAAGASRAVTHQQQQKQQEAAAASSVAASKDGLRKMGIHMSTFGSIQHVV